MDENPINQLKKIERDENFLIKGLDYKFTVEGKVDWKAMVPVHYLYINNDPKNKERIEKLYGKSYADIDIIKDNVRDSDLVILLGGLRYLAKLIGYKSVTYRIKEANPEYAAVSCSILFCGNYENEFRDILYEDNACASLNNTSNFATKYLVEICSNRAFCRTVRGFANLQIVSREELSANPADSYQEKPSFLSDNSQIKLLSDVMESKRVTFAHIREKLTLEGRYDPAWTSINKLPKDIIFELISRLKKKPEAPKVEVVKEVVVEPVKIENV